MRQLKSSVTLLIGLVAILVTLGVYALTPFAKTEIDLLSAGCLLGAEILSVAALLIFYAVGKKGGALLITGAMTFSAIFMGFTLVMAVLFEVFWRNAFRQELTVMILLLGFYLVALLLLAAFGSSALKKASVTTVQSSSVKVLEDQALLMKSNPALKTYEPSLTALYDAIVSMDHSVFVETDQAILDQLRALEPMLPEENNQSVGEEKLQALLQLIRRRNVEVRNTKTGSV